MSERQRQHQFQQQFLAQLRGRAEKLIRGVLPADRIEVRTLHDGDAAVRDRLARLGVYDRDVLETLPGRHALQFRFRRPRWHGLYRRTIARLRAEVLTDVDALAGDRPPGPVDRDAVLDALARLELLPRDQRPSGVVFASATGFTPEARALVERDDPLTLVLLGGRADGGWETTLPPRLKGTPWAVLFELESQSERFGRLQRYFESKGHELAAGGLALPTIAADLGLPPAQAETLVRQACRQDPRLMTVAGDGTMHVCRSPLADEGASMNMWTRIRRLLGAKPTVAEQVRELTTQRVRLEQQRQEIDQQVDALERQERDALAAGAAAKSTAEKKQIAGRLMRLRRDLQRHRTRATMFSQQIDVLGTQIHHLTLKEQSKQVALPSSEQLAQHAAEAEQTMAELAAGAELAGSIEVGAGTPASAEEEAAILAEFAEVAEHDRAAGAVPASPAGESTAPEAASDASPTEPAEPTEPETPRKTPNPARPELG